MIRRLARSYVRALLEETAQIGTSLASIDSYGPMARGLYSVRYLYAPYLAAAREKHRGLSAILTAALAA